MSEPAITQQADGSYLLSGALTFQTVPSLCEQSASLFQGKEDVLVDLSGVEHTDSAGLALLIEWLRLARLNGQGLLMRNIPKQMMAIAEVSDLENILPLA
jgi:phospholipid transport system transporter-binding protein